MNKINATVISVAALAAVIGVVVAVDRDERVTKGDAVALIIEGKVDWLKDGTKVYRVPLLLKDGGVEQVISAEAPCKRRPKGGKDCYRTHTTFEGKELTDEAPELGRFPASTMSGDGCEGVACSIFLGEDADADEARK